MNNYKSAKNFIKAFSLKRCPTLDDVTAISQKQGFTVRPFLPWRDSDINLIRSLNCDASMLGRFAFSFCSDSVKFIFVLQSLTEAERGIAILHENIHIYLGHLGNNCSATVSEEKQVTDIHAAIDFLISKKRRTGISVLFAAIISAAVFFSFFLCIRSASGITFMVTPGGTHYHRQWCGCVFEKTSAYEISPSAAHRNYLPCSYCNPDKN